MIQNPFEAIVVGSGATGGIAALTLANLGVRVLVIEAGPELNVNQALGSEPCNTLKRAKRIISGESKIQAQHPGFWKNNPSLYINEKENKYITPKENPFIWTQGSQVGGRSLTWGGITLRLSDYDFNASNFDNYGPKWPINYSDLEPHYTEIEKFLKIHGNKDGLEQLPDSFCLESLPFTKSEELFKERLLSKLNYKVIHSRGFGPKKTKEGREWPRSSSIGSTLKEAISTGKVEILSNHIVASLIMNKTQDLAKGVLIIDRKTMKKKRLESKIIVLCASTIQTLKILLNSSEKRISKGLIDPSGKLGSCLMDHISTCRFFSLPIDSQANEKKNELSGAGSFFIPFGSKIDHNPKKNFIRGYGLWGGIDRFEPPDFLKKITNSRIGFLIGHGEVLAYEDNKVSLSNELDKWELPIPIIDCKWKKNELRMVKHMNNTIEKCISASGGKIHSLYELINMPFLKLITNQSLALGDSPPPPGYYVHEVGGAPMGMKETESVLDNINRLWRCKNVLVVDGACWPTSSWQSPTLTMMAITRRACISAFKNR